MAAVAGWLYDPFVTGVVTWLGEGPSIGTLEETSGFIEEDFRPSQIPQSGIVGNSLFRQGGNVFRLRVEGKLDRGSQGDGEAFAYVMLRNLGASGLSTLAINSKAYDNVYFVSGEATIQRMQNSSHVNYNLEFARSVPFTPNLGIPLLTAYEPGIYPGRSSLGNYAVADFSDPFNVGFFSLGTYSEIQTIRVRRPVLTKPLPRNYGAIIEPLVSGRELTLGVYTATHFSVSVTPSSAGETGTQRGALVENQINLLEWQIRDRVFNLVGNGNAFTGIHIRRVTPRHSDSHQTFYADVECVQDLPFVF